MKIRAKCLEVVLKGIKLGASITILGIFLLGFVTAYDMVRNYWKERNIIIVHPTIKHRWDENGKELKVSPEIFETIIMECHNKIEKETNKTIRYSYGLTYKHSVDKGLPDYTGVMDQCILEGLIASKATKSK